MGVKVGVCIPQGVDVPDDITATLLAPTTLIVKSCNKPYFTQ